MAETSTEDFQRLVSVNFGGVFFGLRAAARVMTAQGFGSTVNTASIGGSSPTATIAVYSATKAAVIALTKAAAAAPPNALLWGTAGLSRGELKTSRS